MIDVLRGVSVDASIDVTVRVQFTDTVTAGPAHPSDSLYARNSFAGVFGDGTVLRKTEGRETSEAIQIRLSDCQPASDIIRCYSNHLHLLKAVNICSNVF